jgi:hypothetical protein
LNLKRINGTLALSIECKSDTSGLASSICLRTTKK